MAVEEELRACLGKGQQCHNSESTQMTQLKLAFKLPAMVVAIALVTGASLALAAYFAGKARPNNASLPLPPMPARRLRRI